MATDTRTTNRSYALPYPSNLLAEDVVRLREALLAIDVDIDAILDGLALRPNQTQVDAQISAAIQQAVDGLISGAPGALDTLNELAAALGDDANFATTVTNALAARLQLSGGTMTGPITLSGDPTANLHAAPKQYVDTKANTTYVDQQITTRMPVAGGTFTGVVAFAEPIDVESVFERVLVTSSGMASTIQLDVRSQAVLLSTTNASSNATLNLRGDSTTALNSIVAVGESVTVAAAFPQGGTAHFVTSITVDGAAPSILRWQGGAPTAGTANAHDVYTITAIKTANATWTVLASRSDFR
jgi:hypothetical protein